MQGIPVYGEGDVVRGVGKVVYARGVVLASRAPRVLPQHLDEAGELVLLDRFAKLVREVDRKLVPRRVFDSSAAGFRMAVGEGDIGLDVENRRAVSQIGPEDVQHGPGVGSFHPIELHAA